MNKRNAMHTQTHNGNATRIERIPGGEAACSLQCRKDEFAEQVREMVAYLNAWERGEIPRPAPKKRIRVGVKA